MWRYINNPENKILYEGKIKNEIPLNSTHIQLYNDDAFILYDGEIKEGKYEGNGTEYSNCIKDMILYKGQFSNNFYIYEYNLELDKKDIDVNNIYIGNVVFLSYDGCPGKTCLVEKLVNNYFPKERLITSGFNYNILGYEYNKNKYYIEIWDTSGVKSFLSLDLYKLRIANIVIYLFDLTKEETLNEDFFYKIKENINELNHPMIYLVGNKLELTINTDNFRKKAKELISKKVIDKYFEVSDKTGEGIEILLKNIEIDSLIITATYFPSNLNPKKIKEKKKDNCLVFWIKIIKIENI